MDDAGYFLDRLAIVRRKGPARLGENRTKRLVLEIYDPMAEAAATSTECQTFLDRPPGRGREQPARSAI